TSLEEAITKAPEIGFPMVVRPSYVLGGRAMEIVYDEQDLRRYMTEAVSVSNDSPVLLDNFLDDAIEVDIDAICDCKEVVIGGMMELIEQAVVDSRFSPWSLSPQILGKDIQDVMREHVRKLALERCVLGLMRTQFAEIHDELYLIDVHPRAARTVA